MVDGSTDAAGIPTEVHRALVAHLLEHSVRRGDFVLKSGARSDWFIDSKQTACDPDGIVLMAAAALAVIPPEANAIGGLTVGADPVAYGVAAVAATQGRHLHSFTIRKESKDHGVTGRLAGPSPSQWQLGLKHLAMSESAGSQPDVRVSGPAAQCRSGLGPL